MYLQLTLLLVPFNLITAAIALPQANDYAGTTPNPNLEALNGTIVAVTSLGMQVECLDEREAAPISDCSRAMMRFPQNIDPHLFHPGPIEDIYRLPTERIVGQCLMRVGLMGDRADFTSWLAVGTVALQLELACANQRHQFGFGLTGGYTYTGSEGRITVSLLKVKKRDKNEEDSPSVNNNTISSSASTRIINGKSYDTTTS